MIRRAWLAAGAALGITVASVTGAARPPEPGAKVEVVPVRGHMYLMAAAGANITVSAGPDGVFLVDTGLAEHAGDVLAAVERLQAELEMRRPPEPRWAAETRAATNLEPYFRIGPPKPIRFVANTGVFADHVGGNERLVVAGTTYTGGNVAGELGDAGRGAALLAHENALGRLARAGLPTRALPTDTYFGNTLKLSHFFNGEGVQLIHLPAASTDSDSIVHFRGSDVVATGDVFDMEKYPALDVARGGSIRGLLDALNRLLDLAIPEFRTEGGTLFVPGHGRISDMADVAYYRDMVTVIRDRVHALIDKGQTLEQIQAARPSEDWDPRYGQDPFWTPAKFVEAIYSSLVATSANANAKP
jgi:glyoxylase-like metal-dependent hydrolase (beta-lactamase superfamily II)